MSAHKDDKDFRERLNKAADAKKTALEKFRAQAGADDPAAAERRAAREAISTAREARAAERKRAHEADAARREADAARHAAEASRQAVEQAARDARLAFFRDVMARGVRKHDT